MTLWLVFILLCFLALAFLIWPLYRSSGRLTSVLAVVIVVTIGLSAALYHFIGNPGIPSGAGSTPPVDDMIVSLQERLEENPTDVNGWTLLGRSYQSMKLYDEAIAAFEKAVELEQGQNPQTLIGLGIALLEQNGGEATDRSTQLFENALALSPDNPNALFYSGGAAARRGDTALAADRWERLLAQDAPPEIRELLQRKISEWRGLPPPAAQQESPAGLISVNLSISDAALSDLPADATVYVIARDPAQPSPPIAVTPRRLSDRPAVVSLSDRDAMVAGRPLSAFSELEIVARVSVSGSPMAQSGDWQGSLIINANDSQAVDLLIDQKVP
jgi:cytochrome c-type biogenesis protein CcmH